MLLLLPIVIALAAEPSPVSAAAASPAPASAAAANPTPLREIGRVRALPACVPIVAHANGAITEALDNDRTLAILSTNLHNVDYEKLNSLQLRNALDELMAQAGNIRIASASGDQEIKRLRELAKVSPDPKRQKELKDFADALGGALYRQKKAAAEVMSAITVIRGREDHDEAQDLMQKSNAVPPFGAAMATVNAPRPLPVADPRYNKQMKGIGDAMDDRVKSILVDEGAAADHSIAATSGC